MLGADLSQVNLNVARAMDGEGDSCISQIIFVKVSQECPSSLVSRPYFEYQSQA